MARRQGSMTKDWRGIEAGEAWKSEGGRAGHLRLASLASERYEWRQEAHRGTAPSRARSPGPVDWCAPHTLWAGGSCASVRTWGQLGPSNYQRVIVMCVRGEVCSPEGACRVKVGVVSIGCVSKGDWEQMCCGL